MHRNITTKSFVGQGAIAVPLAAAPALCPAQLSRCTLRLGRGRGTAWKGDVRKGDQGEKGDREKGDSLTRPHGVLPSLKPDSVDWIPGAPPDKSLTGMQFQYEAPMRHRPEAFAADSAIRGTPSPRGRPVDL
jgi:hypothetical protein